MLIFETILILLFGATLLSIAARRLNVPYPTLLALGGAVLVFVPGAPELELPPELILALFVAPVLLDAAYDASLRDLRRHWVPVTSLALAAVVLTTISVAAVTRWMIPDMPWAAAVTLGALVAPPDAVAALAVLRQVKPPYRMRVVLEGESLLNDASALLIYKLAIGAVAAGTISLSGIAPEILWVSIGSVVLGFTLAWPVGYAMRIGGDAGASVIIQFVTTFGVWLLAEALELSSIITTVVFALTLSQYKAFRLPARLRIPSFTVWETATTILNVLAFTLVGLQLGPILDALGAERLWPSLGAAAAILVTVIATRLAWTLIHHGLAVTFGKTRGKSKDGTAPRSVKDAVVIGWAGMRGIVTLAAAMALPGDFPYRDFIQLTAFVVVVGTLVLQGLTLGPLLRILGYEEDATVDREVRLARDHTLAAALAVLEGDDGLAARRLHDEYSEALRQVRTGNTPYDMRQNSLRVSSVTAARDALDYLRDTHAIGDEAYRIVEEELDWEEIGATSQSNA